MVPVTLRSLVLIAFAAVTLHAQNISGEAVYKQRCASCHDGSSPRVPPKAALQRLSSARILRVLDFGTMISVGYLLKRDERDAVSNYLGAPPAIIGGSIKTSTCSGFQLNASSPPAVNWNGWSA